MAKVTRKPTGVRRSAAARGRSQKARAARRHTASILDRTMAALPFTEEQWHKFFLTLIILVGLAFAWAVASFAGVPDLMRSQLAASASRAGYEVRTLRVTGVERMNEQSVYERLRDDLDRPMPLVDVGAIRENLLDMPWVEDARVSRQLPDMLRVDIVERVPHAALQKPDRLVLVDAQGNELEPITSEKAEKMLTVSGPGAQRQVGELTRLLDNAPALKPQIAGAEWIGNRRWNLTFRTGQMLTLPEGENGAKALVKFAEMDGRNRLIGGKAIAIDMRVPDRAYLRCEDGPCPRGLSTAMRSE
ncbi:FtsQ-type POTRA domain-containing protein [Erythrobacter litoralis]|uniref:cell division protein FtsQ/DivIB n=1 Tax=Erythrobacter litoralis TaxID=39960 RepID=UPI0024356D0D|nr:FtsQ-type POTRA domain-containing protein [Erythrobacter litoralis]MDG6077632.1 FtsQ-type POTRA domain-containing protein [Erythrobacter litoralis]